MTFECFRVNIATFSKNLKKSRSTVSEKVKLEDKRIRLLAQISSYEKQWSAFTLFGEGVDAPELGDLLEVQGGYDEEDATSDENGENNDDDMLPEFITLFLPSNLSRSKCQLHGLEDMGRTEAKLRLGQLNDSLHHLRVALGEKSLTYRKKVLNWKIFLKYF